MSEEVGSFSGLGDIFVSNLVRKRRLRQNSAKKETAKYVTGKDINFRQKKACPLLQFCAGD